MVITLQNIKSYLIGKGITSDVSKCSVQLSSSSSSSVENSLFRVQTENGNFVVKVFKESLVKSYPSALARFSCERAAIRYLDLLLDERVTAPIVFFDESEKVICMPDFGVTNRLDQLLISGGVDLSVFKKLGVLLADIHRKSRGNKALEVLFSNDLYHEWKMNGKECLKKNKITFVHNDLSLENIFVLGREKIFLLDFEGVCYGDPAQDAGFFLAHLFLDYYHKPERKTKKVILLFWRSYLHSLCFNEEQLLEKNVISHILFSLGKLLSSKGCSLNELERLRIKEIAQKKNGCKKVKEMLRGV